MLMRALSQAKGRVIIVTPFVRRRTVDPDLRAAMRDAVARGVTVYILYGMKPRDGEFDDSEHERRRATRLLDDMGPHRERLRFVRLTRHMASAKGVHSKVLICDDEWAVVTSFNWLSIQETDETGYRVTRLDDVRRLASQYERFLHLPADVQ
ncbi:MAG: hypothetical protein FJX72_20455 [Armatimonadetes bacterium]|nr:hypothetical protein [Armatimonadota bacterium]